MLLTKKVFVTSVKWPKDDCKSNQHCNDVDRNCQKVCHGVSINESNVKFVVKSSKGYGWPQEAGTTRILAKKLSWMTVQLDIDHLVPLKQAHEPGAVPGQEYTGEPMPIIWTIQIP